MCGRSLLGAKQRTAECIVVIWTQRVTISQSEGNRLQSMLKEDDDMVGLWFSGRQTYSERGDEGGDLTNFPVNTAKWCIFSSDCMWASFQMCRSVETYNRSCQNYSDILNVLIRSLFENEQSEDAVILHDGGQFPGDGQMHGTVTSYLMSRVEAHSACLFRLSFLPPVQVHWRLDGRNPEHAASPNHSGPKKLFWAY